MPAATVAGAHIQSSNFIYITRHILLQIDVAESNLRWNIFQEKSGDLVIKYLHAVPTPLA